MRYYNEIILKNYTYDLRKQHVSENNFFLKQNNIFRIRNVTKIFQIINFDNLVMIKLEGNCNYPIDFMRGRFHKLKHLELGGNFNSKISNYDILDDVNVPYKTFIPKM